AACPDRTTKVVVDMDMFYMACELLTKPHLDQHPACVGRGMVLTSNYKARQYGVRSAMAGFVADALVQELSHGTQRLIHVPAQYSLYQQKSKEVMMILKEYDPHMKSYSLDEAYLDLGPYLVLYLEHFCCSRSEDQGGEGEGEGEGENVDSSKVDLSSVLTDSLHQWIRNALTGSTDKTNSSVIANSSDDVKDNKNVQQKVGNEADEEEEAAEAVSDTGHELQQNDTEDMNQYFAQPDLDGDATKDMNGAETKQHHRHRNYMKVLQKYSVDTCNQAIQTVVHHMRGQVQIRTGGLTCSAGMAPHSGLAKMASDLNKPNGQLLVDPHKVLEFLHPLPVRKVPGIGRVTQKILHHVFQVETVQDLYEQRALVQKLFKKATAHYLLKASLQEKLDAIADKLSDDMVRKKVKAHTITVKVKLNTFDVCSKAKSLDRNVYIQDAEELKVVARELFASIKAELAAKQTKSSKKKDFPNDTNYPAGAPDKMSGSSASSQYDSYELCCRLLGIRCSSLVHQDALPQQKPMDKFLTRTNMASAGSCVKQIQGQGQGQAHEHPEDNKRETPEMPRNEKKRGISLDDIQSTKRPKVERESNTCPLCNSVIIGNNDELNQHIDTCLNASTVREVVREVTQSTQEETTDSKKKPAQKQKLTDFW
ncbi:MAG: hypothetical protein SGBAC_010256, partial [Bacillariaceae sp.]